MLFSDTMSMGERFVNSLAITVLGVLVVFAVLVIIAFSLNLLKAFFGEKEIKKKYDGSELVKAKENTNIVQDNSKAEIDKDLIAVLTAAVAAQSTDEIIAVLTATVLAQSGSTEQIIIKSIVPVKQKSSIWASAGRQEQMLKTI